MARPPARPALLRTLNDRTVVELLLAHGPMTRADIATLSGLSKPTAGEALTRLLAEGVVGHAGVSSGRPGPSAQAYAVDLQRATAAAVVVTPQRVSLEIVDVLGAVIGHAEARRRSSAPPAEAVRELLTEALPRRRHLDALVVSVPGVYDSTSDTVAYADGIPEWTRPGLAAGLRRLGIDHVLVDNDVNLAAVAERHGGAGQDEQGFALLWIDEGLGLALDTDGALHRGATGVAGEIGYMPVRTELRDQDGRPDRLSGPRRRSSGARARQAARAARSDDLGARRARGHRGRNGVPRRAGRADRRGHRGHHRCRRSSGRRARRFGRHRRRSTTWRPGSVPRRPC